MPSKREGTERFARELDDIFTLLTRLDEEGLLSKLPVYMADNPDNMPSLRLYEGDLKILMDYLIKMDEKIAALSCTLSTAVHDIRALQSNQSQRSVVNNDSGKSVIRTINNMLSSVTPPEVECASNKTTVVDRHMRQLGQPPSWAEITTAEDNSYSLSSVERNQSSDEHNDREQPFTVYESRKIKGKRQRELSQLQEQKSTSTAGRSRRQPLMIGKSSHMSHSIKPITAARQWSKKAVFCVDNVDVDTTTADLQEFVGTLSVNVISCFEVKPRRLRSDSSDTPVLDRKAFRLCISEDDIELLLNPEKWPAHIVISEWFFKPKRTDQTSMKRARSELETRPDNVPSSETAESVINNGASDMDATIILDPDQVNVTILS